VIWLDAPGALSEDQKATAAEKLTGEL